MHYPSCGLRAHLMAPLKTHFESVTIARLERGYRVITASSSAPSFVWLSRGGTY